MVPLVLVASAWKIRRGATQNRSGKNLEKHKKALAKRWGVRPDRHIAVAVARSEGQGRRFFSAAEGLSLTNASTAAGCP